jgi:PncC family amidohydrolase
MQLESNRILAEQVYILFKERQITLAAAESCTGGALSASLTAVPGASDYFLGSIVSYSHFAKIKLLGVPEKLLSEVGAVSAATAEKMLQGVLETLAPSIAVAITGFAGPTGGELPVGTVYVAFGGKEAPLIHKLQLSGTREEIIEQTVHFVLKKLLEIGKK